METMTIKEIAEICKVSETTVKRSIHKLYPTFLKNGVKAEIAKEHCIKIVEDIKNGFMEPIQNGQVPIQNGQVSNDRIERLENMVEKLITSIPMIISETVKSISVNQSKQLEYKQDYFSIIGYANYKGIEIAFSDAVKFGREAGKLSKENNIEIRKVPDERWGQVNSYNIKILEKIFQI